MKTIVWMDPSQGTKNAGDHIIADAVRAEFARLDVVPGFHVSTRARVDPHNFPSDSVYVIGGTNLLNSDMPLRRWWDVRLRDVSKARGAYCTLGVGWWQYQRSPNLYTRAIYRRAFIGHAANSVRDSHTKGMLARIGVPSVNTSCVTTWGLGSAPERSNQPGRRVVATITDYNKAPQFDKSLLNALRTVYDEVVVWPQGAGDAAYIQEIAPWARVSSPGVPELNAILSDSSTDYCGTRLHAGIRALQLGARTFIVEVDNRAAEIGRDIGLPTLKRDMSENELRSTLESPRSLILNLPHAEIETWRSGFRQMLATP